MQVAGVSQTVNVMGSSPVVDTQSAAGGVTIDQAMMNQLPVQRSFYNLARIAPGVTNDNVGATMLGSTGAENKYIIDGVDSTGIMAGQQKKTMLLDFIDQVNIKTEGTNAEIGGATGGVIEAITKSGSNSFHGSGFVYGQGGGLIATNTTAALRPTTTTTVSTHRSPGRRRRHARRLHRQGQAVVLRRLQPVQRAGSGDGDSSHRHGARARPASAARCR